MAVVVGQRLQRSERHGLLGSQEILGRQPLQDDASGAGFEDEGEAVLLDVRRARKVELAQHSLVDQLFNFFSQTRMYQLGEFLVETSRKNLASGSRGARHARPAPLPCEVEIVGAAISRALGH